MSVPFNSAIIAHEKMSAFAYMTIFDAILKLVICYVLYISPIDKLVTYAIAGVCVSVMTTLIYWVYCFKSLKKRLLNFVLIRVCLRKCGGLQVGICLHRLHGY